MPRYLSIFEKSLFWLLLITATYLVLVPKLPLITVTGTFVAIRGEDFLLALSFFLWFAYLIISHQILTFFKDKLMLAFGLFFFIGAVSVFSAWLLTQTVLPHLGLLHLLRRVEFMLLLPFAYTIIKQKQQLIAFLIIFSLVILAVCLYALGQQYLNWPVISTTNSEFSKGVVLRLTAGARVNSTFAGHYDLAVFLVMSLVVLTTLFFYFKQIFLKAWILILISLSFLILVMTAARLSFAAAIIGVIFALVLSGKKTLVLIVLLLAAAAVAYPSQLRDRLISTVTVNFLGEGQRYIATPEEQNRNQLNIPTLPVQVDSPFHQEASESSTTSAQVAPDIAPGEPIDTTQLGVYRSFSIRFNVEWPRAIRAFLKNPFLGTGFSSLGLATDNDILRLFGEVGILGFLSFALIMIEMIKRIWRNYLNKDKFLKLFSAGTLALIFGFVLNGLFIDVFESSKIVAVFWLVVGLNLAAGKILRS